MALLDCQLSWLANVGSSYLNAGEEPHRLGNAHANIVPYQLFRGRDARFFMVAVGTEKLWGRFCHVLGIEQSPGGHHWEDFDANAEVLAAGGSDFGKNVIHAVESIRSRIVNYLPEASSWPEDLRHPAFVTVLEYRVRYDAAAGFVQAIQEINQGLKRSTGPARPAAWLEVIRGGQEEPTFVLVFPHQSWSDMKTPAQPFWARVEEVFGPEETERFRAIYRKAIVSRRSLILAYRPDLSSVPDGK